MSSVISEAFATEILRPFRAGFPASRVTGRCPGLWYIAPSARRGVYRRLRYGLGALPVEEINPVPQKNKPSAARLSGAPTRCFPEPQRGGSIIAQGSALGFGMTEPPALKGRDISSRRIRTTFDLAN